MGRKRKDNGGRNPAFWRLVSKLETAMADCRRSLRPTTPVSMNWRQRWAVRGEDANAFTSWRNMEAGRLLQVVLKAANQVEELALAMTAMVNEKELHEIDKPDSLIEDTARGFVEEYRVMFAEVILSGGDE